MREFPSTQTRSQLGRYSELEYILLGDLRELLESRPSREHRAWLLAILDALLETLPEEFSLKEAGGYMADVLDTFPHWEDEVRNMQREHEPLCASLAELRERVASGNDYRRIARLVGQDLREWMERLLHHNREECRLFQAAANLEIGGSD